jgi:hypothetical protein
MIVKRSPKTKRQPKHSDEWLSVVESLDQLMARHASEESTRMAKPPIDPKTLVAVNAAYVATLRYYTAVLGGGKHDAHAQKEISRLWQKAGTGIRRLDPVLADQLKATNPFWSNDVTWQTETMQKAWACLNSIRISANILAAEESAPQRWSLFSSS